MKEKIAHLTSVHDRSDVRVFTKECSALARSGYRVHLITADGRGHEWRDDVEISDIGKLAGRLNRVLNAPRAVLEMAVAIDADLYHLHDPELMPIGLKLKRFGKRVIFDAHEDFPKQLLNKPYLGQLSATALSAVASVYERYACSRFDGIVAATPVIRNKFAEINPRSTDVLNYPRVEELTPVEGTVARDPFGVCYIGGLTTSRGICEVVEAMELVRAPAKLRLYGRFLEPSLEAELRRKPGWSSAEFQGQIDRTGVRDALAKSSVGLVTLHAAPNHVDSLPVKMFEYMAAGIPVIASDFPLWRKILSESNCGVCVNPRSAPSIASAIDHFLEHPEEARRMGENGRRAVNNFYNWRTQEEKLLSFYAEILGGTQ